MTDPKPGTLAIFVRAEIKKDCEGCFDCRQGMFAMANPADIIRAGGTPYRKCGGEFQYTVTLAGWVKIELANAHLLHYRVPGHKTPVGVLDFLHNAIVKMLVNNTCPDEIRAQLNHV